MYQGLNTDTCHWHPLNHQLIYNHLRLYAASQFICFRMGIMDQVPSTRGQQSTWNLTDDPLTHGPETGPPWVPDNGWNWWQWKWSTVKMLKPVKSKWLLKWTISAAFILLSAWFLVDFPDDTPPCWADPPIASAAPPGASGVAARLSRARGTLQWASEGAMAGWPGGLWEAGRWQFWGVPISRLSQVIRFLDSATCWVYWVPWLAWCHSQFWGKAQSMGSQLI